MDVEDPVRARHDLDRGEIVLVYLEQSRHQTGGVSRGPSGDAILDSDPVPLGHGEILPARTRVTARLLRLVPRTLSPIVDTCRMRGRPKAMAR